MKFTLTLGNVTLTASETRDRRYLKFGQTPVSKKQLEAIGFQLKPEMDATEMVKFMARKVGASEQMVIEGIAALSGKEAA